MLRVVLGLFVAAIWLPVLVYFAGEELRPLWVILTGGFTVPLTVLVAAPLLYFVRRRVNAAICLVAGAGIGLLGAASFFIGPSATHNIGWIALLVSCGAASGGVFWLIGVYRNPLFQKLRQRSHAT